MNWYLTAGNHFRLGPDVLSETKALNWLALRSFHPVSPISVRLDEWKNIATYSVCLEYQSVYKAKRKTRPTRFPIKGSGPVGVQARSRY